MTDFFFASDLAAFAGLGLASGPLQRGFLQSGLGGRLLNECLFGQRFLWLRLGRGLHWFGGQRLKLCSYAWLDIGSDFFGLRRQQRRQLGFARALGDGFQHRKHAFENCIYLAHPIDGLKPPLIAIEIYQRFGLGVIHFEAITDGHFVIVGTMVQRRATAVTLIVEARRRSIDIVGGAAVLTGAASREALHEHVEIHVHEYGAVQRLIEVAQHTVQGLGLGDVTREAVEDETLPGIVGAQALANDAQHDVVGDQLARIHSRPGLQPQGRTGRQRRPQQIAGGDMRDAVFLRQFLGLGPLAGTGRSEQHNSHEMSRLELGRSEKPENTRFPDQRPFKAGGKVPVDPGNVNARTQRRSRTGSIPSLRV